MKIEDVKVGMKVKIPKTKSYLPECYKDFLFNVKEKKIDFCLVSCISYDDIVNLIDITNKINYRFLPCDLEPYEEPKEYPWVYEGEVPLIKDEYIISGFDVYVAVDLSKNVVFDNVQTFHSHYFPHTFLSHSNIVSIFKGFPISFSVGKVDGDKTNIWYLLLPLIKKEEPKIPEYTFEQLSKMVGEFKLIK